MKKWHTAAELAGLDGMPGTISGVVRKAKRERYIARFRRAQGGGKEYHISSLPEATKDNLHRLAMKANIKAGLIISAPSRQLTRTEPRELQNITDLKEWQREIFDARLVLYNEFKELKRLYGTTKAWKKMVIMAETDSLPEYLQEQVQKANARRGNNGRTLSKSMILKWDRDIKSNGIMALAPPPVKTRKIPDWAPIFIKCYGTPDKPSLTHAIERMANILPADMEMPSYHQVHRFHKKRSRLDRERGRRTGSEMKAVTRRTDHCPGVKRR